MGGRTTIQEISTMVANRRFRRTALLLTAVVAIGLTIIFLFHSSDIVYPEQCEVQPLRAPRPTYVCPFIVGWDKDDRVRTTLSKPRVFLQVLFSSLSLDLLPHFVEHYSSLGLNVSHWIVCLHLPFETTAAELEQVQWAKGFLESKRVPYYLWRAVYSSEARRGLFENLLRCQNVDRKDWVIYVDADEFQEWKPLMERERAASLPALLRHYEKQQGYLWIRGELIDRVAADGNLLNARLDEALSDQYPLLCSFSSEETGAMTSKVVAFRGGLQLHRGHHFVEYAVDCEGTASYIKGELEDRAPTYVIKVSHYKWRHDVKELLERRVESYKAMGLFWWRQSAQLLEHIEKYGRICVDCISCERA